jgi:hypothetical protein
MAIDGGINLLPVRAQDYCRRLPLAQQRGEFDRSIFVSEFDPLDGACFLAVIYLNDVFGLGLGLGP